uniref:Uncharacterized protein n=1 Tax=viral metagenome TaxID=1070528 RepID=A0A6M3J274_9ZZZZ
MLRRDYRAQMLRIWLAKYQIPVSKMGRLMGRSRATIHSWKIGKTQINDHSFHVLKEIMENKYKEKIKYDEEFKYPII